MWLHFNCHTGHHWQLRTLCLFFIPCTTRINFSSILAGLCSAHVYPWGSQSMMCLPGKRSPHHILSPYSSSFASKSPHDDDLKIVEFKITLAQLSTYMSTIHVLPLTRYMAHTIQDHRLTVFPLSAEPPHFREFDVLFHIHESTTVVAFSLSLSPRYLPSRILFEPFGH